MERFGPSANGLPPGAYQRIVEHTANPFVVIDLDGTIRYASLTVDSVIGWRPEQLVGRNMVEFLQPDEVERALQAISEINTFDRSGQGVPMVFGIVRPDGSTAPAEVGAMPMLDLPDVRGIVLRLRDYTAQRAFDDFLAGLLAGDALDDVLIALAASIATSLGSQGAVIHHGFDGTAFHSASGVGVAVGALPLDRGPWCQAVRSGAPCHRSVSRLDPAVRDAAGDLKVCWTVPILTGHGVAPGALSVWRTKPGPPLAGHRHVLEGAARHVELALVHSAEHRRLRHLAGHDSLTGVANRAEFRRRLASALAIGERDFGVAFCDLDGFKLVNDTWGHQAGDAVLVEVADRLRHQLRTGDELARIGGDEFTALVRNVADDGAALHVATRLLDAVREPFVVAGEPVQLGLSVGVAASAAGATADELLARADEALYEVKRSGGHGVRVASF
jgi:diguanylate cyclase (GGDEF)-like protein/PAS domain S-box-containing protein